MVYDSLRAGKRDGYTWSYDTAQGMMHCGHVNASAAGYSRRVA